MKKKNKVLQMINTKRSKDIPIILKNIEARGSVDILYFDYSEKHSGGIILNPYYRLFCLKK